MTITKNIKLVFFLVGILQLLGCKRHDEGVALWSYQKVELKANIGSLLGSTTTGWQQHQAFGLFIKTSGNTNLTNPLEANRQLMYQPLNDGFQLIGNPIYYPQNSAIDFIAYAPYKANLTTTYPIDISNQSDPKTLELLYSDGTKSIYKQENPINISFDHQLSKIVFSLRSFDNTTAGLENVQIALKGFHDKADFDLATGAITNATPSINPIAISLARQATVIPNTNLSNKIFSLTIDGITYDYTLPTSDAFEKGKIYNYLITINNKKITVSRSNITPWISNSSGIDDTGSIKTDPIEYAYIPAGVFQMGAPDTSNTIQNYEKPQHWVRISKSFYMSKHEITVAQYAEFLNAIGVTSDGTAKIYHNIDNESTYLFYSKKEYTPYFENNKWVVMPAIEKYPMQGVTWHGALAYAQWKGATLPTEAQWEYAYRATTKNKFFTGNFGSEMMAYGYYYNNTGGYVKPVGEKLANPWGLFDIAGNVLEWCLDGPENNEIVSYPTADSELYPIVDPLGKISNTGYAYYRGGNYSATVQLASAYSRNSIQKEYSAWQIGFRIVLKH